MWSGDLILMMSNTLDYLSAYANWAKIEPASLIVPPGKTVEAKLAFDTEKMEAGAYKASLSLSHNAPAGANPLSVPVALTVNAKNCLEASVSSIDFGKVWLGNQGKAAVTLSNPCNRPTQVTSLSFSSKLFKTSAAAPIAVPAFSDVQVELTYAPDDLNPGNGTFTVKSDAKDHPSLALSLKGAGIKPPSISVKPSSLSLTLDPAAKATKSLDVYNAGGDTLRVKVAVLSQEEAAKALGAPKLTAGKAASSRPLIGESRAPLPYASARNFRSLAGGSIKVLFVHSLGMPPEGNAFVQGIRDLQNVASVDLLDVEFQTPNAAYLHGYDVVLAATDYPAADPVALGGALADYVDAGGRVVLLGAAFYAYQPFALGGRIMDPAYLPISVGYADKAGKSISLANHPINAGVSSIFSALSLTSDSTQGNGQPLGVFESGHLVGAYNPDKPVVALNYYPIDGFWGGDILLQMGNTLDYLTHSIRWMKTAASELAVAPGKTAKLSVAINASELEAGKYLGLLRFQHNAPQGPSPLDVPVALQVKSKRCLTAETKTLDFGRLWKGGFTYKNVIVTNHCNEITTVNSITSADGAFYFTHYVPTTVDPFSSAEFEVAFSPKDAKLHQSKLIIASDAQDNPSLAVALKGLSVLPPTISVTPGSLSESVGAAEVKKRTLTISNKGGDTLDVQLQTTVQQDGKAAAPGGKPALKAGRSAAVTAAPAFRPFAPLPGLAFLRRLGDSSVKDTTRPKPVPNPDGFRVLYFNTLLPDGYEDDFLYGLRTLPNVSTVDAVNGEFVTPNFDFLLGYDQVVVASGAYFADPVGLGDALAEYVDRGGRVCLMTAAISNWFGLGLQGRIAAPEYMPMTMEGPG
jgi:hypothetical protein